MMGFGFGTIIGLGVYGNLFMMLVYEFLDFTVCFGITSIYSMYYHKKAIKFHLKSLLRDFSIYLLSLAYIIYIFKDY